MKIRILSSALQDLREGYEFYEKQAEGIGAYFMDSLFSDIDSLILNAGLHPIYFGGYHQNALETLPLCDLLQSRQRPSGGLCRARLPAESRMDSQETEVRKHNHRGSTRKGWAPRWRPSPLTCRKT